MRLALGVLAAGCLAFIAGRSSGERRRDGPPEAYIEHPRTADHGEPPAGPEQSGAAARGAALGRQQAHGERGEAAARQRWTRDEVSGAASAVATLAGAAFAAGAFVAALDAVGEARRQADAALLAVAENRKQVEAAFVQIEVARQAIIASERPWVRVDVSMDGPVNTNFTGVRFPFKFVLKNVGNSPAMLVSPHISIVPDASATDLLAEQRKLCEPLRAGDAPRAREGLSQFPDQEFTLGSADYVYWRDVDISTWNPKPGTGVLSAQISPALVGCITYRFASGDDRQHQTGFVFSIYRTAPNHSDERGPIEVRFTDFLGSSATAIPPDEIGLRPNGGRGAGFYAD